MRWGLAAAALLLACQGAGPTGATPRTAPSPSASETITSPLAFELTRGAATIRIREQLITWSAPDDAVLTTDAVTGRFGIRDDGSFDPASHLSVALWTLESDDRRRADAARETMNANRFPLAEFRPVRAEGVPAPLPRDGRWELRLVGPLTVNGISRETAWDAVAERAGDVLRVTARTRFQFGDFAMDVPRRGPVLSLVDDIRLEIDAQARAFGAAASCTATAQDVPANYKAGAPARSRIGDGSYVLTGVVRSARGCGPVAGASVELWHANRDGAYDDEHRAIVSADAQGRFRLATVMPAAYGGGRAHIHIRVTAPGHRALVSISFPAPGTRAGEVDLVLEPS